ncbi:MAG: maleate isomerase [Burkholderiales bacterium]|jgi:maleate isomerase
MNNQLRRFGVLAPPGNIAMERELPSLLPAGVTLNHNRLSRPGNGITSESLLAMANSIERAAHDLAQAHPEIILYGCTSGSFLAGVGREAEIAQRIADMTGIAAVTTSTAVIAALRAVKAQRVFMVTPYPDDINAHEVEFLAHYGIAVGGSDTFRCQTSEAIRAVASEQVGDLVLRHKADIAQCDAVFISCTNLLTTDQIDRLEGELGKPVISSNQASLWTVLRHMDIDTSGIHAGCLFARTGEIGVSIPS